MQNRFRALRTPTQNALGPGVRQYMFDPETNEDKDASGLDNDEEIRTQASTLTYP